MSENKIILQYCPNFYNIVNYETDDGDAISDKLISIYREYIFRANPYNEEDIENVKEIDHILNTYIEDYAFRKELKNQIIKVKISRENKDVLKEFINYIINIFNNYEEFTTRVIYVSRWI
jgi:hypothetical protein